MELSKSELFMIEMSLRATEEELIKSKHYCSHQYMAFRIEEEIKRTRELKEKVSSYVSKLFKEGKNDEEELQDLSESI